MPKNTTLSTESLKEELPTSEDIPEEIFEDLNEEDYSCDEDIESFESGLIFDKTNNGQQMSLLKRKKDPHVSGKIDFHNKDAKMSFNISLTKDSVFF